MPKIIFKNEEQKELVSIIIPAYNRIDYIKETIDSVLNQSYQNIELIVVDDGSSDGTFELLQGYGNKLTLLTHPNKENKGQSESINLGLKECRGEYIAILDSDDYWNLNYLSEIISYYKKNTGFGLVYSSGIAVDSNGNHLYNLLPSDHRELNKCGGILLDCYICLPGESIVKRKLYQTVGGFDTTLRAAQDHDMLVRMAEKSNFGFVNKKLFYYRQHEESISKKGLSIRWPNGFIILDKAIKRTVYPKSIVKKRKAVLNYRLATELKNKKFLFKSFYHFFLSFVFDPVRALKVIFKMENK